MTWVCMWVESKTIISKSASFFLVGWMDFDMDVMILMIFFMDFNLFLQNISIYIFTKIFVIFKQFSAVYDANSMCNL